MSKVDVLVQVEERITYARRVEMTEAQYKKLQRGLHSNSRGEEQAATEAIRDLIDPRSDISDVNDVEVLTFSKQ